MPAPRQLTGAVYRPLAIHRHCQVDGRATAGKTKRLARFQGGQPNQVSPNWRYSRIRGEQRQSLPALRAGRQDVTSRRAAHQGVGQCPSLTNASAACRNSPSLIPEHQPYPP